MKHLTILLSLFLLIHLNTVSFAQNEDSVKAYIMELLEPEVNFTLSYGTGSVSLEYIEQKPLTPLTEEFIEEKKKEYDRTNDPMALYAIGQTYRRMNRRQEGYSWQQKALSSIEEQMGRYPDSIELVESAFLIYMETGKTDLAIAAAKMISQERQNSNSLFAESLSYTFTQQYTQGIATANEGLKRYPGEARWYLMRIIHEFYNKMSRFGFGSEEFTAPENRIDRSFLDEAFAKYSDSAEVELISVLGNFFLFAYDEVLPQFYEDVADFGEIEGFTFNMNPDALKKINTHEQKVAKLSKRKEFKNWHSVHFTLGVIHLLKNEFKQATKDLEKAIALMEPKYRQGQDNVYTYYDDLIASHRIQGNVEAAEKCAIRRATEEINLDPVPQYYIERALYRTMDNDFETAHRLLDETIALDSSAIDAYTYNALLMMYEGNQEETTRYLDLAQSVNPNDLFLFKAVVIYNLLLKSSNLAKDQINQLEAYDPTNGFIQDARRLLKTTD